RPERKSGRGLPGAGLVLRIALVLVAVALLFVFSPQLIALASTVRRAVLGSLGLGLVLVGLGLGAFVLLAVRRGFWALGRHWNVIIGAALLICALWGGLSFFSAGQGILRQATLGGEVGQRLLGSPDLMGGLRLTALALVGVAVIAPRRIRRGLKGLFGARRRVPRAIPQPTDRRVAGAEEPAAPSGAESTAAVEPSVRAAQPAGLHDAARVTDREVEILREHQREPILTPGGWQIPPIDTLEKPAEVELNQEDLERRARLIEEALGSYGVEGKVVQINRGPTVTQYGVEPGWDRKYKRVVEKGQERLEEVSRTRIRVDRITGLANDLALALSAPSIRIEAPVPGKPMVGIEVPNTVFGSVSVRSVVESTAFQKIQARSKLAVALGKGAGGEAIAVDLARMPHLLIAGATGSGKTVCLDSLICCLLLHNSPDDVRFVMVDPKRVELVVFDGLPHLIAPVVVDTDRAVRALKWLSQEMDRRYRKFSEAGVRSIEGYNKESPSGEGLPYLVLVIDELADLMMAAFDEVEHRLCRLAQLARATGIHLIVATQRPSVDVVTGLIKANFPTRISFAVTSQVDSRTILDMVGAEKLLGRGDMLYMASEHGRPKRLQGCFVSDAEIAKLAAFWRDQRPTRLSSVSFDEVEEQAPAGLRAAAAGDPLLEEARRIAQEHKQISVSFLQRRLRIGYPRAARLMEALQGEGPAGSEQPGKES
ncbi:MAG: DNA translocase FtsK, partial [Chloroflexota bacterium]